VVHEFAPGRHLLSQDVLFERPIQNLYMSSFAEEPEACIIASQQGAIPSDAKQAKGLFLDDRPEVCRFAGFCGHWWRRGWQRNRSKLGASCCQL
jgi:hypothetical protein